MDEEIKRPEPGTTPPGSPLPHLPAPKLVHLIYGTWWFRFILAGLSGLLLAVSFPSWGYGFFAWVAIIPLLLAVFSAPSLRVSALLGFAAGFVFYTIDLGFFYSVFPIWLALVLTNILSLYLMLFAGSIWTVAKRLGLAHAFLLTPIFWTGLEYFRSECYFLKFSWLSLGYSQHSFLSLIQVCDLFGIYGLSFIIISFNTLLAWTILEKIRRRKRIIWSPTVPIILLFLVFLYGAIKVSYAHDTVSSRTAFKEGSVDIAVIQAGFESEDLYIQKTRECVGGKGPVLVVWPETVVKEILEDAPRMEKIKKLVKEKNIYLIIGTAEPIGKAHRYHNLAVMFSPDGEIIGKYAKRILVQFVETGLIKPGSKTGVFDTPLGRIGALICYETGFSHIVRDTVAGGAEFLVAPTLEIMEGGDSKNYLHASMVPFRAIETRRAIVRPAVYGVSMIVNEIGEIQAWLNLRVRGVLRGEITRQDRLTFYVRFGYLFPIICLIIYLFLPLIALALYVVPRVIEWGHSSI